MTQKSPDIVIDMTIPRSMRPMVGLDIEEWRGGLDLSKFKSQYALGFRNINHYNRIVEGGLLPVDLELLIRIYEESPQAMGWDKFSLKELYNLMYGDVMQQFEGTKWETYAKVDLGTRFTRIFGRSPSRKYQWLSDDQTSNAGDLNTYAVMECILAKLRQMPDPKGVLERLARKVWLLRGHDLDLENPIPSLRNPPTRRKTGRKSNREEANRLREAKGLAPLPARRQSAKLAQEDRPEDVVAAAFGAAVMEDSNPARSSKPKASPVKAAKAAPVKKAQAAAKKSKKSAAKL